MINAYVAWLERNSPFLRASHPLKPAQRLSMMNFPELASVPAARI